MNKERQINIAIWLFVFFISLLLSATISSRNDDFVFASGIEKYGSLFDWACFYGKNWSGRLIPHAILVVLLQLPDFVFCFLNGVVLTAIMFVYSKEIVSFPSRFPALIGIVTFAMMFSIIPASVLETTVFWKCASVLYLWSVLGFLLALRPFLAIHRGKKFHEQNGYWRILAGFMQVALNNWLPV